MRVHRKAFCLLRPALRLCVKMISHAKAQREAHSSFVASSKRQENLFRRLFCLIVNVLES
jgi:hypothetical protein